MPSHLLPWCSAPPFCPLPPRTITVTAVVAEEEEQGVEGEVEVWAQGAACPLYTAWFSHRTNCTPLSPTRLLGPPFAPKSELTRWSAKCSSMSAWTPTGQERAAACGTGWEGDAVGQPHLRPAKLPKVHVVRVLKVCAAAEAPRGAVIMKPTSRCWCCWAPCACWSSCCCSFAVTCGCVCVICVQSSSLHWYIN